MMLRYLVRVFSLSIYFLSIFEPNFSDNYILDVGDILEIVATGKISTKTKVKVMRNGVVQIRDIGSVMVAGLTVSEAINKINSFASNRLIELIYLYRYAKCVI